MLTTDPLLLEICEKLENVIWPDWIALADRFQEYHKNSSAHYTFNNLVGALAELNLRTSLEEICRSYEGRIIFDPIKPSTITENFRFDTYPYATPPGNLEVRRKSASKHMVNYSEIDQLLLVDELPVLFESKFCSDDYRHPHHGDNNMLSDTEYALSANRIRRSLKPLRAYFKRSYHFGCVFVLPKNKVSEENAAQTEFKKMGGLIVPFFGNLDEFRSNVSNVARLYRLLDPKEYRPKQLLTRNEDHYNSSG